MLDQIVSATPDRFASVQWHANSGYPLLYRQEAWDKWHLYPPPMNNAYYYPWLWVDGVSRGFDYNQWQTYVAQALAVPTDIGLAHAGTTYEPGTRLGTVRIECINGTSAEVRAVLQFVITEDSIRYETPNGDTWHNHVCRDYVPNHNGTPVVLPAGGADTVDVAFQIDAAYNEQRCNLVAWIQNMTMQPDSSLPCFQGLTRRLLDFSGVAEKVATHLVAPQEPASSVVRGVLRLPPLLRRTSYSLLSISGRKVMNLVPGANDVSRLAPGVYFVSDRAADGAWRSAAQKVVIQR
jgi:hypothetical protein